MVGQESGPYHTQVFNVDTSSIDSYRDIYLYSGDVSKLKNFLQTRISTDKKEVIKRQGYDYINGASSNYFASPSSISMDIIDLPVETKFRVRAVNSYNSKFRVVSSTSKDRNYSRNGIANSELYHFRIEDVSGLESDVNARYSNRHIVLISSDNLFNGEWFVIKNLNESCLSSMLLSNEINRSTGELQGEFEVGIEVGTDFSPLRFVNTYSFLYNKNSHRFNTNFVNSNLIYFLNVNMPEYKSAISNSLYFLNNRKTRKFVPGNVYMVESNITKSTSMVLYLGSIEVEKLAEFSGSFYTMNNVNIISGGKVHLTLPINDFNGSGRCSIDSIKRYKSVSNLIKHLVITPRSLVSSSYVGNVSTKKNDLSDNGSPKLDSSFILDNYGLLELDDLEMIPVMHEILLSSSLRGGTLIVSSVLENDVSEVSIKDELAKDLIDSILSNTALLHSRYSQVNRYNNIFTGISEKLYEGVETSFDIFKSIEGSYCFTSLAALRDDISSIVLIASLYYNNSYATSTGSKEEFSDTREDVKEFYKKLVEFCIRVTGLSFLLRNFEHLLYGKEWDSDSGMFSWAELYRLRDLFDELEPGRELPLDFFFDKSTSFMSANNFAENLYNEIRLGLVDPRLSVRSQMEYYSVKSMISNVGAPVMFLSDCIEEFCAGRFRISCSEPGIMFYDSISPDSKIFSSNSRELLADWEESVKLLNGSKFLTKEGKEGLERDFIKDHKAIYDACIDIYKDIVNVFELDKARYDAIKESNLSSTATKIKDSDRGELKYLEKIKEDYSQEYLDVLAISETSYISRHVLAYINRNSMNRPNVSTYSSQEVFSLSNPVIKKKSYNISDYLYINLLNFTITGSSFVTRFSLNLNKEYSEFEGGFQAASPVMKELVINKYDSSDPVLYREVGPKNAASFNPRIKSLKDLAILYGHWISFELELVLHEFLCDAINTYGMNSSLHLNYNEGTASRPSMCIINVFTVFDLIVYIDSVIRNRDTVLADKLVKEVTSGFWFPIISNIRINQTKELLSINKSNILKKGSLPFLCISSDNKTDYKSLSNFLIPPFKKQNNN
jgi:hypothetical protein